MSDQDTACNLGQMLESQLRELVREFQYRREDDVVDDSKSDATARMSLTTPALERSIMLAMIVNQESSC